MSLDLPHADLLTDAISSQFSFSARQLTGADCVLKKCCKKYKKGKRCKSCPER